MGVKRLILGILLLALAGCAGHGEVIEYKWVNDQWEPVAKTEAKGKGIAIGTSQGAKMETKSFEIPSLPQNVITGD